MLNEYVTYFHEVAKYDGLYLYWRKVTYNKVLGRLVELHPQVELSALKEEFLPDEPSTITNEVEDLAEEVDT